MKKISVIIIVLLSYTIATAVFAYNYSRNQKSSSIKEVLSETSKRPQEKLSIFTGNPENIDTVQERIISYSPNSLSNLIGNYKVFIYFTSNLCKSCDDFITAVKNTSDFYDDVVILTANIDKDRGLLSKYGVNSTNTIVQLDDNAKIISKFRNPKVESFKDNIK